jgi:hypothetical protein
MDGESLVIKIGAAEFPFRPMTLRQIRDLTPILAKIGDRIAPEQTIPTTLDFLLIALKRTNPEITADAILDLEATTADLVEAMNDCLRKSGYKLVEKAPAPGEKLTANQ